MPPWYLGWYGKASVSWWSWTIAVVAVPQFKAVPSELRGMDKVRP